MLKKQSLTFNYYHLSEHRLSLSVIVRAVIIIDDIDVTIEKSCDIHIDTEMWILIFIDIGSSKNFFFPGGLHHGGFKTSLHTPGLYAPDILTCLSDSYIKVLPNKVSSKSFMHLLNISHTIEQQHI